MKKTFIFLILLSTLSFLISCTGSESDKTPLISMQSVEINCWINKMPGPDYSPKFHLTGDFTLLNNSDNDIASIEISYVSLYQNEELVLNFNADLSSQSGKEGLNAGESAKFSFSAPKKLDFSTIDESQALTMYLELIVDDEPFTYNFNDIPIEIAH